MPQNRLLSRCVTPAFAAAVLVTPGQAMCVLAVVASSQISALEETLATLPQ